MKQVLILSFGFVAITGGLLAFGLRDSDPVTGNSNEVSRAEVSTALTLQPAVTLLDTVQTEPTPAAQLEVEPVLPEPVVAVVPQANPAQKAQDDAFDALRAMSYGIVKELQKPADVAPTANRPTAIVVPQDTAALVVPTTPAPKPAAPTPAVNTYTVQKGDSLPGISFRFYGTTSGYLRIVQANSETLSDPSRLTAGMVLIIP